MKKLTNSKIVALCMGDFSRGMINGIVTTFLLTFFIPTNANTTLSFSPHPSMKTTCSLLSFLYL